MEKVLEVENLQKIYGKGDNKCQALSSLSFSVMKEEFVGVMGASGSGKTTLLNCISTIDEATSGSIIINGQDITRLKNKELSDFRGRELGFIFQDFNLLDTLTIRENIALALTINQVKPSSIDGEIDKYAKLLGIYETLNKYPYQVSGGEKQRASAVRALITHPSLIMADEPTGALDSKSSRILLETMKSMNEEMGATIMMVTHDAFAASYCKRVIFIKDGKLFNELYRGNQSRKEFFDQILEVVALLGGDADVH